MLEELVPLCRGRADIQVIDVDSHDNWRQQFGDRVPVLCHAGQELAVARLDRDVLLDHFARQGC